MTGAPAGRPPWWAEAADRAIAALPVPVAGVLRRGYAVALPLRNAVVPLTRLTGTTRHSGRRATVLVAGSERWTGYLPARLFAQEPQRETLGRVPLWRLARMLREIRSEADLTIVRSDRCSAHLLRDDDYLEVPEWIGMRIPLPVDLRALAKRSKSVAEDLRKTRRDFPHVEVTRGATGYEAFYRDMFVPYTRARYGAEAYVRGFHTLRRSLDHGGILWVRQDGRFVAASMFERHGAKLDLVAIGVPDGDVGLRQQGAVAALYVHVLEHAQREGCTVVDLRGARPSLADGLVRYKCKWGARFYDKTDTPYSWLVHWTRLDGVAAEFLAHTPLVFREGAGFAAAGVVEREAPWTGDDVERARHAWWVDGLDRLVLIASAPCPSGVVTPPDTLLVDQGAVRASGPATLRALLRGAR